MTSNMRDFLKDKSRTAKTVLFKDFPGNLKDRLKTAWEALGIDGDIESNKNNSTYTFKVEKHAPTEYVRNSGFSIHNNTQGHPGAIMTMLYYYDIKGITSELRFYPPSEGIMNQVRRKGVYSSIKNIGKDPNYNGRIQIEDKNVIAFKSNIRHKPVSVLKPVSVRSNGNVQFQRNVLAIFVIKPSK